ncbi:MAG: preprotein translocase subunit SecG [Candidatus Aminicenantaceae bacterium]
MTAILTILHIMVCAILIVAVLLQSGKAADLAGAFGGAGSQSAFGPRGAQTVLTKMTTISAVLFMFTSMGLWIMSSRQTSGSVLSGEQAPPLKDQPAATATTQPGTKAEEEQAVDPKAAEKKAAEKKAPEKKESETEKTSPPPKKK